MSCSPKKIGDARAGTRGHVKDTWRRRVLLFRAAQLPVRLSARRVPSQRRSLTVELRRCCTSSFAHSPHPPCRLANLTMQLAQQQGHGPDVTCPPDTRAPDRASSDIVQSLLSIVSRSEPCHGVDLLPRTPACSLSAPRPSLSPDVLLFPPGRRKGLLWPTKPPSLGGNGIPRTQHPHVAHRPQLLCVRGRYAGRCSLRAGCWLRLQTVLLSVQSSSSPSLAYVIPDCPGCPTTASPCAIYPHQLAGPAMHSPIARNRTAGISPLETHRRRSGTT